MNRARRILEIVKDYKYGIGKQIRDLERRLGLEPKDLDAVEDIYDYLDWLKNEVKKRG